MNNLDKHKRFMALLSSGQPIPADLANWYLEAANKHKQQGKPLCVCLGIRGAGIRSAKNRELIIRRDSLLRFAASSCSSYCGEPLWNRCGTLAALIRRYPRSKHENPLLQHIFELGCNVPASQNGIYERIVKLGEMPYYSPSRGRR